jgi:hypothetical protein
MPLLPHETEPFGIAWICGWIGLWGVVGNENSSVLTKKNPHGTWWGESSPFNNKTGTAFLPAVCLRVTYQQCSHMRGRKCLEYKTSSDVDGMYWLESNRLMMMMAGGEGPSSPKTPRPYRQALCAPFWK